MGRFAALLLLAAAGCTSSSTAPTTAPTTTLFDTSDPRPLLTVSDAGCMMQDCQPLDMPYATVYPDGTVVSIGLPPAGDVAAPTSRSLVATTYQVDAHELDRLVRLATAAGLASHPSGGPLPMVPLPPGMQMADEGYSYFVLRTGNTLTSQSVDGVGIDPGYDTVPPRDSYAAIVDDIRELLIKGTPTGHPTISRWAIVAVDGPTVLPSPSDTWTGPPLDSLTWTTIGPRTRCAIVTRQDWPTEVAGENRYHARVGGADVSRRPILPHEHDCSDVATFRTALGM